MTEERLARFVDAVKDDARVLGIARLASPSGLPPVHVLIVTTWDGFGTLPSELRRALEVAFEGTAVRAMDARTGWCCALGADGVRIDVELRRAGDLKPTPDGVRATVLHDPRTLVEQWTRYSEKEHGAEPAGCGVAPPGIRLLHADLRVRMYEGGRVLGLAEDGGDLPYLRRALATGDPVEAALAARIDAILRTLPGPGKGDRVIGGPQRSESFETFLQTADHEGFKGDRVLFNEAVKRLRELSGREPVFDQGFLVPTFDAVEAGFALGEAVGGCKPPLVPGVYVGVGVTPKDALEFWAAPFVRDPTCSVACVDDTGDRDVVARTSGREPMLAALTLAVDTAWDLLPGLIESARTAMHDSVDPAPVLASLHLPKSFVERSRRRGAGALMCSRLTVALAVARAGDVCAPLVARKLGLAAGRVLAGR